MAKLYLNTQFIYNIRPEKITLIGVLCFVIVLLVSPINFKINGLGIGILYIISCILAFIVGTYCIKTYKRNGRPVTLSIANKSLRRFYRCVFLLGLFGVCFRFSDLLVVRHLSLAYSSVDNLDYAKEGGGNIFSILSGIMIYFSYVPVTIDILFPDFNSRPRKIVSLIIFLLSSISAFLLASRFSIVIPLLYYVSLLIYAKKIRIRKSIKTVLTISVMVFVLFSIVGVLFFKRVDDMGMAYKYYISTRGDGYTKTVPPTESYQKFLNHAQGSWYYMYCFTYLHISQYATHAVFEFEDVKKHIDKKGDFYYGAATFSPITKFVCKLFNIDFDITKEIRTHNARNGIWSTFFFLWYLDFGWLGPFVLFLMGLGVKYVWSRVYYKYNIFFLPLLIFAGIIILFFLQLNFISGNGCYAIVDFCMLPGLAKKYNCHRVCT